MTGLIGIVGMAGMVGVAACASAPPVVVVKDPGPPVPKSGAPVTAQADTTETYHGVVVHDPYRWLEDGAAPEVKAFADAQNAFARATLDKIGVRPAIEARLREILSAATVSYGALDEVQGQLYALKLEPPKQQRFLVAMPGPDAPSKERVVFDPTTIDATGKTAIDWYRVSPDGKWVALSLSAGGSETGDVHVFEVATGKAGDVVPGVNAGTAGGDLAWLADSSGFYYSRYPRGAERPKEDLLFYVQLYRHQLGTPTESDVYELGKDFPRIAEVFADVDKNGDVVCTIQKGDGGEFELWFKAAAPKPGNTKTPAKTPAKSNDWTRLASFEDRIVQSFFGPNKDLYLVSLKDAPHGKLVRVPRANLALDKAKVIIPEGTDTLVSDIWDAGTLAIHGGKIFATFQLGGPSEIRVFDLDGKPLVAPQILPVSAVGGLTPLGKNDILYSNTSFVEPLGWYVFTPSTRTASDNGKSRPAVGPRKTAISAKTPVDLAGVQVSRTFAISKDGTKVPVNVLLPKGATLGNPIPFVVTGYGGYANSIVPSFQSLRSVFLDHGVGLAILNLRGGSEYGEAWHQGGALLNKQNVFDDFIASTEHLIAQNIAARGKIGIIGGSNGGLLMGAVMTQRPDLFAAVTSVVGIYDMLRVETEPNGAFNTTEFGSVKDEAMFKALHAYSPYHHVVDGTNYPPTLFLIGANDIRVAPWHSRKFVARLQTMAGDAAPHLLVTSFDSGHGIGSSVDQVVQQNADGFAFLMNFIAAEAPKAEGPR